jgi:hypothetical protein
VQAIYHFILLLTLPITARYITGDSTGFFYIADENNSIIKIDSTGKEWFRYSDITQGTIYSIDAANPFRTLLFYRQQQVIQILDNNLGLSNTIQLRKNNLLNISAVARASDNNIWIYDALDMSIKKINDYGKPVSSGADLFQLVGHIPQVTFIKEENHKLFVCDTTTGVLLFDEYLNYEKTIPLKHVERLQIINNSIMYFSNNVLTDYNLNSLMGQTDSINTARPFRSAFLYRKCLIALEQNAVSLYRITP